MYTPHGGGGRVGPDRRTTEEAAPDEVGAAEHYSCALVGLVAAVALVALVYPLLVAVTKPLHLLSSTALVVILAAVWFLTWLCLELVWEWQATRRTAKADADGDRPSRPG